jgi:hypothetical protein
MPKIEFETLWRSILQGVKDGSGDFVEEHADAHAFVVDRAKRTAELVLELPLAADDAARDRIKEQLGVVEQSIENELSAVAVDAAVASRAQFEAAVKSVFGFAMKVLPGLL